MKNALHIAVAVVTGFSFGAGCGFAQGALHTDTAGNPVTSLNLGGGNVTGTLAAERLPSGARPPVVQTISATSGGVTLGPGTNVVVLGATLTGGLNLTLPTPGSYPAGRALVIVDPGGYSSGTAPVRVAPAAGNTLNGATGLLTVLADSGSVSLYPTGTSQWTVGQSSLLAPSNRGLVLRTPGRTFADTSLQVLNGDGITTLSVLGNGTTSGLSLSLTDSLTCDDNAIGTDGLGGLSANQLAAPEFCFSSSVAPADLSVPDDQAVLYFGQDGRLHCRTPDGNEHVLSWTTP